MSDKLPAQGTSGLDSNVASMLSYLLMLVTCGFPVAGAVFLAIEKNDKSVRFHAWQSIFLSIAYWVAFFALTTMSKLAGMVLSILGYLFAVAQIGLVFVMLTIWVICIIKSYQNEEWKIPIIGDLAAKQAGLN